MIFGWFMYCMGRVYNSYLNCFPVFSRVESVIVCYDGELRYDKTGTYIFFMGDVKVNINVYA